jgi:aminopeptidase 2
MESIEARSAFPCFDEPDMKATFNITVVSKPPHTTLSNMPVYATEDR